MIVTFYRTRLALSTRGLAARGRLPTRSGLGGQLVLNVDQDPGCGDLARERGTRRVLVAGIWQLRMDLSGLKSRGPSACPVPR